MDWIFLLDADFTDLRGSYFELKVILANVGVFANILQNESSISCVTELHIEQHRVPFRRHLIDWRFSINFDLEKFKWMSIRIGFLFHSIERNAQLDCTNNFSK
ncbi:MAG: hypothetical protein WA775_12385 [Psychroserpens sp.]|uniref:hypothetical protein n=1 Tax=Psychroserpens sp. TaxID=2020870 RepID=UPI003C7895D7